MINTIVINKDPEFGINYAINGGSLRFVSAVNFVSSIKGVMLQDGKFSDLLAEYVTCEKWTVGAVTGFENNAELVAELISQLTPSGGVIDGYQVFGETVGSRYRIGLRGGQLQIDRELTSTGFDGLENTDWENAGGNY